MNCEPFKPLLAAYTDGELDEAGRRRLDEHLAGCPDCRKELEELKCLAEELRMLKFREPEDAELQRYWAGVYNRLERGLAWVLFSLGAIILGCYGGWLLIEEIVRDPTVSVVLKVGLCTLVAGTVILLVSVLRERLAVRKADRYSREIQR